MFEYFPPETIDLLLLAFKYIYFLSPVWLPVILGIALFSVWLRYKRAVFFDKQETILLEIKLPKNIDKSPAAMEVVLSSFFQTGGESTWVEKYWKGQVRPWFSLEIVSFGGRVVFYIWTWAKFKNIIESQIYSQYAGIEVHEVPDYAIPIHYDPEKTVLWGCEWRLTQPDAYPIKTYTDYGIDSTLIREEQKVDPMTPMLEFLGSLTDGHEVWVQIIIRAHKKEQRKPGTWFEKTDAWKDQAQDEIKKIIEKFKPKEDGEKARPATKGEQDIIAALERSVSKLPFDCGIRTLYISDKEKFNPANIGGLIGSFRQYSSFNLNGFAPTGWFTIFNYPWQDYYGYGRRKEWVRKALLEEYKMRSFFFSSFKNKKIFSKPFVLNTEELATIYHFPGAVATTPTFERIPSRKVEAPANLPI